MKTGLRLHLFDHSYPPLLLHYPQLIRFIHAWNQLFLQRNWLTLSLLRQHLPVLPAGSLVVDAGCGDGLHIFSACRTFRQLRFWGVDKNEHNIHFCKKRSSGLASDPARLQFFHQQLEELSLPEKADLTLCVGTLQYIADDRQVLENFYNTLKINGKLLIYIPVNGRIILPLYRYFFKKLDHYEKSQNRLRVYTPEEIFEKIETAGFTLRERHFTYGPVGIAGHEIYSLLLMGLGNSGGWIWLLAPVFSLLMPLVLLLKTADYFLPKNNGNGVLIMAEKSH